MEAACIGRVRPTCLGELCTKSDNFDLNAAVVSAWLLLKAVARASQTFVNGSDWPLLDAANLSRVSDTHMEIDG